MAHAPRRYRFVAKMDTNPWFNACEFWDRFLARRLEIANGTEATWRATVRKTVFNEPHCASKSDLMFPHRAMCMVTWDMMELLVSLQERHGVVARKDMALAMLLLKGHKTLNFVNM